MVYAGEHKLFPLNSFNRHMEFEQNRYYNLASFGKEAIAQALLLLKSYPLTKFLLKLLGKHLIFSLQCGLFTPDYKIIEQAEKGKDLFLLCKGSVDVIVNGQLITQMNAPSLVGDKGIITKKAIRAATISVSDNNICLFIKIPMDKFLRDYKDSSIDDAEFIQEQKIYNNIFQEIQNRLFKFSHLQKKLWGEVSKSLNDLNTKLVCNTIEKNKSVEWDPQIWSLLGEYVKNRYHLQFPEKKPINLQAFNSLLIDQLKKNYPPNSFGCSGSKYNNLLRLIYRKWLNSISRFLIQHLPKDQLPINVGELNVINPRNYRDKLQVFFNTIEKKFMIQDIWRKQTNKNTDKLKIHHFFGKEIDSNEFDLDRYLKAFETVFNLNRPKRILAQLAEETARIAASLENEFNSSVSQMQQFLQKVQTLASFDQKGDEQPALKGNIQEDLNELSEAIELYRNKIWGGISKSYGAQIKYHGQECPTLQEVLSGHAAPKIRKNIQKSFFNIIRNNQVNVDGFSKEQLQKLFGISIVQKGQYVNYQDFYSHFWIPVGGPVRLQQGPANSLPLKNGLPWGGEIWKEVRQFKNVDMGNDMEDPDAITLKYPNKDKKEKNHCPPALLIIPHTKIPWHQNKQPDSDIFLKSYLPLMQWFINCYLDNILNSHKTYKDLGQKWESIVKTIIIEEKVRKFETGHKNLPEGLYKKILSLIEKTLGIQLEKKETVTSENLSRQLYSEIRKNTQKFHQHLNYEEQNNKTYSLWRYMQGEIISKFSSTEIHQKADIDPLPPVFVELSEQLEALLKNAGITPKDRFFSLNAEVPVLNLTELYKEKPLLTEQEKISLFMEIFSILELEVFNIFHNSFDYQKRLEEFSTMQIKMDMKELKTEFIVESAEKLVAIIQKTKRKQA